MRARHEGARFETDVFLSAEGLIPLGDPRLKQSAHETSFRGRFRGLGDAMPPRRPKEEKKEEESYIKAL